jgi:hypothetical protein
VWRNGKRCREAVVAFVEGEDLAAARLLSLALESGAPTLTRRGRRVRLAGSATISLQSRLLDAEARNLGPTGALLSSPERLPEGSAVVVSLPGVRVPLRGKVARSSANDVAVVFDLDTDAERMAVGDAFRFKTEAGTCRQAATVNRVVLR